MKGRPMVLAMLGVCAIFAFCGGIIWATFELAAR